MKIFARSLGTLLLVLWLLSGLFFSKACAQTYQVQSFDGAPSHVRVVQRPSEQGLAISCLRDTLILADCWALDQVKVLNKQFLQITYAIRAGSNEGLGSTLLLCVNQGKLRQALKVESYRNYDMRNLAHIPGNVDEYELFQIQTQLLGTTSKTYKLKLIIHDESRSKTTPATNHLSTKQVVLSFDASRQLFYTRQEKVTSRIYVLDPKTDKVIALKEKDLVPVIALPTSTYYFVKGEWFAQFSSKE
jgi:hypothetical protein